jgi:hypothetical protein
MRDETLNRQVGGEHYVSMSLQPWEIIDALGLGFYEGTVIKYLLRRKENRVMDLRKAIHYIEHMIHLATEEAE